MNEPTLWRDNDDPRAAPLREMFDVDTSAPLGAKERVFARIGEPRRTVGWRPAALALAVAAGLAVVALPAREAPIQIGAAFGEVSVSNDRLDSGDRVAWGAPIRTGVVGRATLWVKDIARVDVFGDTELQMIEDHGVTVALERGTVRSGVRPRPPEAPYVVRAGAYTVRVVGTRFDVTRSGDIVDVNVFEGVVEVKGPGVAARLVAGDHLRVGEGQPGTVTRAEVKIEAPPVDATVAKIEAPAQIDAARVDVRAAAPIKIETPRAVAPTKVEVAPATVAVASPESAREPATPALVVADEAPRAPERVAPEPAPVAPVEDAVAPVLPAKSSEALAREAYEAARALRDPNEQLRAFDAIAATGGPLAELAGHQAAKIEMRRQRWSAAAERFDDLLERHPAGTLAPEAEIGRIECRVRQGSLDEADEALARYLSRWPNEAKRAELRFLQAELARRRGRCADAIAGYVAASDTRFSEEALYLKAYCQLEIGDEGAGRATLAQYLTRWPEGRFREEAIRRLEKK